LLVPKATDIPGFRVAARYGNVDILEQKVPPPVYRKLQDDGREPQQAGLK
jgi:hypothetical protein